MIGRTGGSWGRCNRFTSRRFYITSHCLLISLVLHHIISVGFVDYIGALLLPAKQSHGKIEHSCAHVKGDDWSYVRIFCLKQVNTTTHHIKYKCSANLDITRIQCLKVGFAWYYV